MKNETKLLESYRDGERQRYGSECINRILDTAPNLRKLFQTNAKKLAQYKEYLAILSGPAESMPRGREYFGSGLYFVGDGKGKDIFFNSHWFFHPLFDVEKNQSGEKYVQKLTPEAFAAKETAEYKKRDEPKLISEIARIELFLAKVLRAAPRAAAPAPAVILTPAQKAWATRKAKATAPSAIRQDSAHASLGFRSRK